MSRRPMATLSAKRLGDGGRISARMRKLEAWRTRERYTVFSWIGALIKHVLYCPPIPWIITLMHYQQDPSSCRLPLLLAGCCTPTVVLDEGHLHSSRNEPIITPAGQDFSGDRELPHGEYKHLYDDDGRGNVRRYNM